MKLGAFTSLDKRKQKRKKGGKETLAPGGTREGGGRIRFFSGKAGGKKGGALASQE